MYNNFILVLSIFIIGFNASAQDFSGHIMFSPLSEETTYLLNPDGTELNRWECSARPASTAHLLPDGSIMRPYKVDNPSITGGAVGGGIQRIDWDGNVMWDYTWSSADHQQHHECIPIDKGNGNYNALIISWENHTNEQAIQSGRQNISGEMWATEIIEIEPSGTSAGIVVWKWHFWDHLCQDVDPTKDNYYADGCESHPELLDINVGNISGNGGDWIHANGMDYSPVLDQIVFSSHNTDEIYVIDRSTTSEEAASHEGGNSGQGGDLLYRWGNPQNYGAGTSDDQILHVVHGANFIDEGYPGAGNILVFNNGDRPGFGDDYSSVEEIITPNSSSNYDLPFNQLPTWLYSNGTDFYANHLSGAFRLPNGNTLATEGTSCRMSEINPEGEIVAQYSHQLSNNMAKATFYPVDYEGLGGGTPSSLEGNGLGIKTYVYPNPADESVYIKAPINGAIQVIDMSGKVMQEFIQKEEIEKIIISAWPAGIYSVVSTTNGLKTVKKLTLH
jgi:hypothetical protein